MPALGAELLLILALVALNGVLAMAEMALVSARKLRLQQLAEQGNAGAHAALELANEPSRFLSTVQIGITLVGILAGVFGGAALSHELGNLLAQIPALAEYREPVSYSLVVLGITFLTLIFGELVPKRFALSRADSLAILISRPMRIVSTIAAPVVWALSGTTDAVLRLLRVPAASESPVTEEEIKILIQQGAHAGVFEPVEQELVEGALEVGGQRVHELMTPRPRMAWLDIEDPPEENWRKIAESAHSAFPVMEGDIDSVLGIVSVKQLWRQMISGQALDLRAVLEPPIYVLDQLSALRLLQVFQPGGAKLALVIDERGSIKGVVTMTDLLEEIAGDAVTSERREQQAVRRPDGSLLLDGLLPIDELKKLIEIDEIPGEDEGRYQSLGGFLFLQLGRVPVAGESFEWSGWRFEIVDMDGRRIDKVLAMPRLAEATSDDGTVVEEPARP